MIEKNKGKIYCFMSREERRKIAMLNKFVLLQDRIKSILNNKYIEEIYIVIVSLISLLCWNYNSIAGISILVFIATITIILTNDLKYIIPIVIFLPFTIGFSFSATIIPIPLIVVTCIFIIVLIIFTILNGIHISKMKSLIPLFGIGITTLIPIFWFVPKNESQVALYFVYFGNILFCVLYFILVNGIKEDGKIIISKSVSYLILLLTMQLIIRIIDIKGELTIIENIFYCGWGLCNEAGIMICFSFPFSFYLLNKSNNLGIFIYRLIIILFGCIGIFFSGSRASYIFGGLIVLLSFITSCFLNKNKKTIITVLIFMVIICICIFVLKDKIIENLNIVFSKGLENNGRFKLYVKAWNIITSSLKNIFFGAGSCALIEKLYTSGGFQEGQVVFHSTFFQTLIVGGIACFIFLLVHLVQKYRMLLLCERQLAVPLFISFLMVDLYGMIDNTYHMFYYMIPLVTILACFDSSFNDKLSFIYLKKLKLDSDYIR